MAYRLTATRLLVTALAAFACNATAAQWEPDPGNREQLRAAAAIEKFRSDVPGTAAYFDEAWGYAVLPSVTRIGFGFGGAWGKGIVVEQGALVGTTGYWQFTSGIQAGAKNFSMIVFFRDKEAIEYFKTRAAQFMGQAGITFANLGLDGTPAYNDGVAVFAIARFGLMGEFTISGVKFTYKPIAVTE